MKQLTLKFPYKYKLDYILSIPSFIRLLELFIMKS